jgi:hypothetical protein
MACHPLAKENWLHEGQVNTNALPNIPKKKNSQDYYNLHNGCKSHETAFLSRDT